MTLRKIKDFVKAFLRKNYPYFIYSYFKGLHYKILPLYYGINSFLEAENIKFNLRRDVHRLEKGLSYENPKPVFAEYYILDVVNALILSYKEQTIDRNTLDWSVSVLNKYFKIVKKEGRIIEAYDKYNTINFSINDKQYIPYPSEQRPELNITYEQLLTLSIRRRSVRFYNNVSIPRELITKAVGIAKLAPSACNRQAFRYLYFDDPVIANRIAQIPGGVAGYHVKNIFVILGEYSGYFAIRDATAPIVDASLSAMSLLYALETIGLGAVCINWPNEPDKEQIIREVIDIKSSEFVIMLIGVGYAKKEGKIPYSKKRSNDDFIYFNDRIK